MYLPQLTSGPSGLAWSPDSGELIYSMAGSLWRQKVGATVAFQLTAPVGAAYDYQPDWSADGRWVIYSSYRADAVELWLLDLKSGVSRPLTGNGAVNVGPGSRPTAPAWSSFRPNIMGDFTFSWATSSTQSSRTSNGSPAKIKHVAALLLQPFRS